jgi:hypothetical protein
VTLPVAATDVEVKHTLKTVPVGRFFIRSNSTAVIDGDTPWTNEAIYLKNTGSTIALVTVIILG